MYSPGKGGSLQVLNQFVVSHLSPSFFPRLQPAFDFIPGRGGGRSYLKIANSRTDSYVYDNVCVIQLNYNKKKKYGSKTQIGRAFSVVFCPFYKLISISFYFQQGGMFFFLSLLSKKGRLWPFYRKRRIFQKEGLFSIFRVFRLHGQLYSGINFGRTPEKKKIIHI